MRQRRQPKDIPPPLELECLKALWSLGEANVRAVRDEIASRRPLAYTTVMTLLDRLVKKGGASRRKQGRAYYYSALLDQDTLRRKAIQELADALFDGSHDLMLSYLGNGTSAAAAAAGAEPDGLERLDASLL